MGYMMHHAIVVSSKDEVGIERAHLKATELMAPLVSPVIPGMINMDQSFFVFGIAPDGSKEGWSESESGDACRKAFIQWLKSSYETGVYVDWAEISFGGDEPEINTKVTEHSGQYRDPMGES